MKKLAIGLSLGLIGFTAQAANIAVVDSGTDFTHNKLSGAAFVNAGEIAGDKIDNDKNGKVDDINGWNFVDNYGRVFFREHLDEINPIAPKLLTVIAHKQAGTVTEEEAKFFDENVTKLSAEDKQALVAHLNYFGTYVHGTHCAGIVNALSPQSKIMSGRVFPDAPADQYPVPPVEGIRATGGPVDWVYRLLAMVTNGQFLAVGTYLNEQKIDVANYSLGMSLSTIAKASLALRGKKAPTEAEIAAETQRLFAQFEIEGKKWMAAAPRTLFVVASGNDGANNDVTPAFPANVHAENIISVGASQGYRNLATFSNYGKETVDVAAPGVSILSTVPSTDHAGMLPLSGTSMAAPFVAGVAGNVKDANPGLTPADMKRILMGTVDKKDWLSDKIVSGGLVNAPRAVKAAELSREMALDEAIARARAEIADREENDHGAQMLPTPAVSVSPALEDFSNQIVF